MTRNRSTGPPTKTSSVSMLLMPSEGTSPSSYCCAACRAQRMCGVTGQTVLGGPGAADRGGKTGCPSRAEDLLEKDRPARAVGQWQPPVGVFVVGARLIDGPAVTHRVRERDAEQATRGRGQRPVQGDDDGLLLVAVLLSEPAARDQQVEPAAALVGIDAAFFLDG